MRVTISIVAIIALFFAGCAGNDGGGMNLDAKHCFYNATLSKMYCGKDGGTLVREGREYSITNDGASVNFCGLAGIVFADNKSDAYLVFILKNESQLIELSENASRRAIAYQIAGILDESECNNG